MIVYCAVTFIVNIYRNAIFKFIRCATGLRKYQRTTLFAKLVRSLKIVINRFRAFFAPLKVALCDLRL